MSKPHIWLRAETKPREERTPLTPDGAASLIDEGFKVTVERDPDRFFPIDDYQAVGCGVADTGSWIDTPTETIILGLKELADDDFPLVHRHIHFAHVFKDQAGAEDMLGRFVDGGGTLYDLEYLVHENGRRVAAFGYWAGFCGAALGVMAHANHKAGDDEPLAAVGSHPSKDDLLDAVRHALSRNNDHPVVLVIGAKGRSGSGASELSHTLELDTIEWDVEETGNGGPFDSLNTVDVLVNCVYVAQPMPPFVTTESLSVPDRRLSVISDVSCDPYGAYNPVPIYDQITTFEHPMLSIQAGEKPLYLIAIDHLPSMLPKESSEDYGAQLLPHLATLQDTSQGVWQRAHDVFAEKTRHLRD